MSRGCCAECAEHNGGSCPGDSPFCVSPAWRTRNRAQLVLDAMEAINTPSPTWPDERDQVRAAAAALGITLRADRVDACAAEWFAFVSSARDHYGEAMVRLLETYGAPPA